MTNGVRKGTPVMLRVGRGLGSSRGQATTEWLMIAGVFAAIGLFVTRIVPGALSTFLAGLGAGIKSVAP